jgi:NDP-4-keto-2,6-dideoxyhexose 3-C-methyltransferase
LGRIYPSDFLRPDETPRSSPVELKLMMDEHGLVTLDKTARKEAMWGRYWYRSGINQTMRMELKNIVDSILPLMKFEENSIWLDIACNDGTLLSHVPEKFIRVGIDPAEDSFKVEASQHADEIVQDYFSKNAYCHSRFGKQKPKVITSIAMFYDLEKPEEFIGDVDEIMDDNGIWVMQLSYSPLMMYQVAFDNIVHEHYAYYSLTTLKKLLEDNGFRIMDCQLNDINGGSFRVYIMKQRGDHKLFSTQPYRDVCEFRVYSLLNNERRTMVNERSEWLFFYERVKTLKKKVVDFITIEKQNGKTIWCYGASTKGNTLLQYFGLNNTMIDGIAERNIDKWGLRTIGTNIPIYSESDMRKAKPDYLLLLPWHFLSEFKEREQDYLIGGGKFIVPCPEFQIVEL